ncbi:MAG: hypothetical protein GX174_06050 [Lentisphaerae bacterium]|nr:hypothetical protein [Lentisphaerota bacterium]
MRIYLSCGSRRGRYGVILGSLAILATLARGAEVELADRPPAAAPVVVESGSWTQTVALLQLPDDDVLREAFNQARNLSTNMPVGEARARLDQWLASKSAPLAQMTHLIRADKIELPASMWHYKNHDYLTMLRQLVDGSRVMVIVARGQAERGAYAEAVRQFDDIFKLGCLITTAHGPIVTRYYGIAVQSIAHTGLRWLASQDGVSAQVLEEMLRNLPVPGIGDPDLAQTYRTELDVFMVPAVMEIAALASSPTNPFTYHISNMLDVSNTLATAATYFHRCEQNTVGTWPGRDRKIGDDANSLVGLAPGDDVFEIMSALLSTSEPKPARRWRRLQRLGMMPLLTLSRSSEVAEVTRQWLYLERYRKTHPNLLGNVLIAQVMSLESEQLRISVERRTHVNLTRAYLALVLVRRRTGSWPASLSEPAVTDLLGQPPIDLFSMRPLRYSREKGMLWSVGDNEVDDGGDSKKDIVIRLPELEAP